MSDCPLSICSGTGLIPVTDFTGSDWEVCACSYGVEPPGLRQQVLDAVAETPQDRRPVDLLNDYLNGGGR